MASVRPYELKDGSRRYYVKYRSADHKQHKKEGFKRKKDAEAYAARVEVNIADNNYVDPAKGKALVRGLGIKWLKSKRGVVKPKYYGDLESAWRNHVEPKWGGREVASILRGEVQAWVSALSVKRSASVVLRAYGILHGIMDDALHDGVITKTPCDSVRMPRKTPKERQYLTPRQVLALADASGRYGPLVMVLGFCGLRWGEAAALRVRNIDLEGLKIQVRLNWVRSGNKHYEGVPKTWETRDVPMPVQVADALTVLCEGRGGDELVFTRPNGERIIEQSADKVAVKDDAYQWFGKALKDSGCPRVTIHDLRHTAASIAISAGANVKAVQRMLGHRLASMTLDTYADLFDSDLDAVAVNIGNRIATVLKDENRTKNVPTQPIKSNCSSVG